MNVKPVVLILVIVGCTVIGWIVGRHTLVLVDTTDDKNSASELVDIKKNSGNLLDGAQTNNIGNKKIVLSTTKAPNLLQRLQQPTRLSLPPNVQDIQRKTQLSPTSSLKAYSHNGKTWVHDEGFCHSNSQFQEVSLQTSVGRTPIYIHDPSQDIWISKDLKTSGHWEGRFVNLVFSLLQKDPQLQFVDLGANIGVFALSVAKLGRQVIAVEPLSINLQRLCKSVSAGISTDGRPFTEKVTIIHNALSDVREQVQLGKDLNNVGGTFVIKDSNEKKVQGSSLAGKYSDIVMTAKLDDLLELPNFNFKKVVLKIDVEGYETKAFRGGQKFFDTVDVQAVMMEWRWHTGAHDLNDLLNFFTKRNYKPYNPKVQPPGVLQIANVRSWPGDVLWLK